jgi:hypothetical protein
MKRKPRSPKTAILLVAVAAAIAPALSALAGAGLDTNLASAFGRLGLTDNDMANIYDNTWDVTDPTLFRFAASLDEPSIDPADEPYGVPTRIGVTWAVWPDDTHIPDFPDSTQVVDGALYLAHGGPMPGTEYALMWAQMGGPIPVEPPMTLFQNWSFPFSIPGSATWQPLDQFPYDTWGNASAIPYITYGPDPFDLSLSVVAADGALLDQEFNGFGLISGDTIIIGVDTGTMFPGGTDGVTYGFAGHIHDGGFGANPKSASLVSFATGTPGNLIPIPPATLLEVGTTPPPTTTTTVPTTTTTLQPTTTTRASSTTSEAVEASGETPTATGFPWIPVLLGLLGIVVIVVGGRMYFVGAKDPCAEYLLAWQQTEKACEEAKERAKKAKRECDQATQRTADLEKLHRDLCTKWPPACEGEGAWAEESGRHETRVTSRDLHARRVALGRLWDDYQAGKVSAQDVEDAWKRADTPEFREEMRKKTEKKITQREKLETDIENAKKRQQDLCEAAGKAATAAKTACDRMAKARSDYDECVEEQNAEAFVDGVMGLGAQSPTSEPAPTSAPQTTTPQTTTPQTATEPADPLAGRKIGVSLPFQLDKTGLSGDELTRAQKLERIFRLRKGTGDLAAVAKDLWQFNNWHIATFGEPWFTWSAEGGDPNSPTSTAGTTGRFMQTRVMACYEFVHFCAYIASDQLGRQRVGGDDDNPVLLDEYSVDWGFPDEINTNTSPLTGQAPSGSVITGSFRWWDYDNSAGYYHTGISIGDGKVISLGSDGLIMEDATGMVDACFPSAGYTNIQFGDYAYSGTNPAPK